MKENVPNKKLPMFKEYMKKCRSNWLLMLEPRSVQPPLLPPELHLQINPQNLKTFWWPNLLPNQDLSPLYNTGKSTTSFFTGCASVPIFLINSAPNQPHQNPPILSSFLDWVLDTKNGNLLENIPSTGRYKNPSFPNDEPAFDGRNNKNPSFLSDELAFDNRNKNSSFLSDEPAFDGTETKIIHHSRVMSWPLATETRINHFWVMSPPLTAETNRIHRFQAMSWPLTTETRTHHFQVMSQPLTTAHYSRLPLTTKFQMTRRPLTTVSNSVLPGGPPISPTSSRGLSSPSPSNSTNLHSASNYPTKLHRRTSVSWINLDSVSRTWSHQIQTLKLAMVLNSETRPHSLLCSKNILVGSCSSASLKKG